MKRSLTGYFLLSLAYFLPSDPNVCVFQMLAPSHVDKLISFLFPVSSLVRLVSALLCAGYYVQHGGEVRKEIRHILCLKESQSLRGGTDD